MMDVLKEQIEDCKKLLAKALLNEALEQLGSIVFNNGFSENHRTEVAKLKTRFASLNAKNRNGLLKTEDYLTEENKIGSALFELLQELEEFFFRKTQIHPPLTYNISKTKSSQDSPNSLFYKHITKGEKLLEIKHYQESVEEYKKAHELFPEDEFVLKQLIIANIEGHLTKFNTDFKNQAKEYAQKAFHINPSNQVFLRLYIIVSELKKIDKYRRVLDIPVINILYFAIVHFFMGFAIMIFDSKGVVNISDNLFLQIIAFGFITSPILYFLWMILSGVSDYKSNIMLKKLHSEKESDIMFKKVRDMISPK